MIPVVIILLTFIACDNGLGYTKRQYINKFEEFISITEKNYMSYDSERWEYANSKFKEYCETDYNKFKMALTKDEQLKIDKLKSRYYAFIVKYKMTQIKNKAESVYNQAEGFIEELIK